MNSVSKEIYEWTDSYFDFDFHESDVGDESKEIVKKAFEEGKLKESDGAIGLDCGSKIGFCVLLTSDGTGLYATKDIALAKRKFEEFNIDRSIYVVDSAQSLHFQQVFKVLEHLGFKQASKCFHLAYGVVTLPNGKMSSRKGTVIPFSELKNQLLEKINDVYLNKYKNDWKEEEIVDAARKISLATIKYGMLKQDPSKDIIFSLEEWTSKTGNTGPYLLYAYARIKSILREVKKEQDVFPDFSLLSHEKERRILLLLHQFLSITSVSCEQYKPSTLCNYLYLLCKSFSSMYEVVSIKNASTEQLKVTRLAFVESISIILKTGLSLLGIETLERM
jgi:arginyl-tRNA synthetase